MHLIRAFSNPVTRPRALIWTGTALTALMLFVAVMVGATTSMWFCAELCHKVQDDTISSYRRSTHSRVSCVACHMPPGADPVTFLLHKVEALAELPPTITDQFHVPLNPESELALDGAAFPSTACTQCHDTLTRVVTPTFGIMAHHKQHEDGGIRCTFCHNRVAHNEAGQWEPRTVTPSTGKRAGKHSIYLSMYGCFRCHGQEAAAPATGRCATCHEYYHDERPSDHKTETFDQTHGQLAIVEFQRVQNVEAAFARVGVDAVLTPARKTRDVKRILEESKAGRYAGRVGAGGEFEWPVAPVDAVNRCLMCHEKAGYCDPCHSENGVKF